MKQPAFRDNQIPFVQDLQEKNEILKDKVKHLESFNRFLAWYGSKFVDGKLNEDEGYGKAFFEAHNHITKKNKNGNLITYYTKETKIK